MKMLTIIVHSDKQQQLANLLRTIDQISGFTFTHVKGHGIEVANDSFVAAREEIVGHTPRIRTDILLEDSDIAPVMAKLRDTTVGVSGQGIYWITPVDDGGRL